VNWMAAIAGAGSFVILFLWLRPADKALRSEGQDSEDAANRKTG